MNILVILLGADGYKSFFSGIGEALKGNGHNVYYINESRQINSTEPADIDNETIYVDEYINAQKSTGNDFLTSQTGHLNFAEVDRSIWFGRRRKDKKFYSKMNNAMYQALSTTIEEKDIQAILYENPSNCLSLMAKMLATKTKIKYVSITNSIIPGRYVIDVSNKTTTKKTSRDKSISVERNLIDFLAGGQPDYMSYNGSDKIKLVARYLNKRKIIMLKNLIFHYAFFRGKRQVPFSYGKFHEMKFSMFKRALNRRVNSMRVKAMIDDLEPSITTHLYAMHLHPESSTSLYAPQFNDELQNIINIANSLPYGDVLAVKDHPTSFGTHPYIFYKTLQKIPNVVFVDPRVPAKQYFKNVKTVLTVAGTVGFEAYMMGIPVVTFSDVFYANYPNMNRFTTWQNLTTQLNNPKKPSFHQRLMSFEDYFNKTKLGKPILNEAPDATFLALFLEQFDTEVCEKHA